jgi:DNA polymerase-3 subunit delta'
VILAGPVPEQLRALAVSIAKSLNCLNQTSGDSCTACQKIDRSAHPDVHFVSVAEDRKQISVEQIRNLVHEAVLRPYEGRFKVFIIDPAEALNVSGENALLKTLEEPARDTVFLLLARNPDLLLPTIRSRSQAIRIQPLTSIDDRMQVSLQAARLRQLALFPGEEKDLTETLARSILESLKSAAQGNRVSLLGIAAELASQEDVISALALLVAILRDLAGISPENSMDAEAFRAIQQSFSRDQLLKAASLSLRAMTRLEVNADVRLMLEQSLASLAT